MAINVQKTKGFPCHKVLPLTFDESLSYYEMVCKLIKIVEDIQASGGGALAPEDREELDNLKQIAQNADDVYRGALLGKTSLQPLVSHLSELVEDTTHRTVTDAEKGIWNNKQSKIVGKQIEITVDDWNGSTTCTKEVDEVTENSIILYSSMDENVECTSQGNKSLTFTAAVIPQGDVIIKVVII